MRHKLLGAFGVKLLTYYIGIGSNYQKNRLLSNILNKSLLILESIRFVLKTNIHKQTRPLISICVWPDMFSNYTSSKIEFVRPH